MNAQKQFEIAEEPVQPPKPPGGGGRISLLGSGNEITLAAFINLPASSTNPGETSRWPGSDVIERRIILVPLADTGSFLAFGLTQSTQQQLNNIYSAPFVVRVATSSELSGFMVLMQEDGAQVEFFAEAPVERLQQYMSQHAKILFGSSAPAATVTPFWEEPSSEESYARTAA